MSLSIAPGSLTGPNIDALAITETGGSPSFFAPVFTSAATASVLENATAAATIAASDGDGAALVFSLTSNGADDALFEIDASTGALSFSSAPDFEAPGDAGADNAYRVEVAVTDGSSIVTQTVTVSVLDDASEGMEPDITADEDGDLAVTAVDLSDPSKAVFAVAGLDADIERLSVALDGGDMFPVRLEGGQFVLDLGGFALDEVAVDLTVEDAAGNTATVSPCSSCPRRPWRWCSTPAA